MCGIAGVVDLARPIDRAEVAPMVETMADRGPDDEGLWCSARAAMGHRRLAVIDVPGGRQPMTWDRDGETELVLVYSGEVYNFGELRHDLIERGHRFRTDSDTEVVLAGWAEWGEGVIERLNGMFAFAVWDARHEELFLVRDRMGVKPLYYYPTPDGVLYGSEPKAILAHPRAEAVVDLDGMRELLAHVRTPGHATYKGMFEVRPGSRVRVRREGVDVRRYWRLEAIEHTDDLDATVAHVRELLEDIVARQLVADVPLCSLLSGGLDSSAITALAAKQLRARSLGPVRSFSVDLAGYEESFAADSMRGSPDGPYERVLAEHIAAEHEAIPLSTEAISAHEARAAVLRAQDLPVSIGDMSTSLHLLFRAVRGRSTVALSGESADEVFGGYSWFHDPDVVSTAMFPWLAPHGNHAGSGRMRTDTLAPVLDQGLMGALDLPGYLDASYRDALADVPQLDGVPAHERRMREMCHLHLTRFVNILLDRKDRMSMASGLEVRVPFCDHRLVQYVFNTPWTMKTFDGREKSLLRATVRDLVPTAILDRVKSPYPSTRDPGYEKALRADAADLFADRDAPIRELIDPRHGSTCPDLDRAELESLLQFDGWMRRYRPRLDL